uniref:C2H2-type domain-containing protein n=1 Tax=Leptobrachium leishanense TaxID=445787 RepID=A0A8C5WJC6_9ANUR
MNKAGNPTAQRMLDLTLEIIYLLTGEDHMVVRRKSAECSVSCMCRDVSEGTCRIRSCSSVSAPRFLLRERHNEQKILELSNQIIRLLTGEVPIRCEDVTVYLSMEEWEYVERHKELYDDLMMEDHRPVITLDDVSPGELSPPVTLPDLGANNGNHQKFTKTKKGRAESAANTKQTSPAHENQCVTEIQPITEQTECHAADIKEETLSDSNMCILTHHARGEYTSTPFNAESGTCGGDDITDPDIYSPSDAQTEYSPSDIKEEPASSQEEDLTDSEADIPTNHTQGEWTSTRVKAESDTCAVGDLTDPDTYPQAERAQAERPQADCAPAHLEYLTDDKRSRTRDLSNSLAESHEQKMQFICSECGKCFSQASHLAAHTAIHTRLKSKGTAAALETRPTKSLPKSSKGKAPFKCSVCGKWFLKKAKLIIHLRIHSGEKPFKCTECGKCFTQPSHLARHNMIHTGEKPYKCSECGKCFTMASHLATHKMIHTGEKPFKCTDCGKCFTQASSLAAHTRIHTGEKPFKCNECGKCFNHASNLSAHRMIHSGEKAFHCPECGKCFTQASSLASHKRIHTGVKPFKCPECGKCFTRCSTLSRHKLIHTGEEKNLIASNVGNVSPQQ